MKEHKQKRKALIRMNKGKASNAQGRFINRGVPPAPVKRDPVDVEVPLEVTLHFPNGLPEGVCTRELGARMSRILVDEEDQRGTDVEGVIRTYLLRSLEWVLHCCLASHFSDKYPHRSVRTTRNGLTSLCYVLADLRLAKEPKSYPRVNVRGASRRDTY
jgi:hypothetical protein